MSREEVVEGLRGADRKVRNLRGGGHVRYPLYSIGDRDIYTTVTLNIARLSSQY
jgi:hypothetical protein